MMMIENPATESLFQARNGVSTALVQGLAKNEEKKKKENSNKINYIKMPKITMQKKEKGI